MLLLSSYSSKIASREGVFLISILLLSLGVGNSQVIQLETYNIEPGSITVSGLSAGGAMAAQMHVIYSQTFNATGLFAGIPYYCARGVLTFALNECMKFPNNIDVSVLTQEAEDNAVAGLVDPTSNMFGDKVYIFHGSLDTTVDPGVSIAIEDFYNYFGSLIYPVYGIPAEHCQPTDDYGNLCDQNESPWINNCNYDGAFTMLKTLYETLNPPVAVSQTSIFAEFDQEEFFAVLDPVLDTSGYIFIPTACQDKVTPCKLHMALHGCLQGKQEIGDEFALNAGYLEAAEANDIIVIFPQAVKDLLLLANPNGCFDWWGYTNNDYANNEGQQPMTLIAMIDRLAGITRST